MDLRYRFVICPYCGAGCGFYLKVKDGELIGVAPSRAHPVSKGRLCVKGLNSWEVVEHKERIKNL